jgi:hypothetical protein
MWTDRQLSPARRAVVRTVRPAVSRNGRSMRHRTCRDALRPVGIVGARIAEVDARRFRRGFDRDVICGDQVTLHGRLAPGKLGTNAPSMNKNLVCCFSPRSRGAVSSMSPRPAGCRLQDATIHECAGGFVTAALAAYEYGPGGNCETKRAESSLEEHDDEAMCETVRPRSARRYSVTGRRKMRW